MKLVQQLPTVIVGQKPVAKGPGHKAYCRCVNADNSKGISICNTGACNPSQVCDHSFDVQSRKNTPAINVLVNHLVFMKIL